MKFPWKLPYRLLINHTHFFYDICVWTQKKKKNKILPHPFPIPLKLKSNTEKVEIMELLTCPLHV